MRRPAEKRARDSKPNEDEEEDIVPKVKRSRSSSGRAGFDLQVEPDMERYNNKLEQLHDELKKIHHNLRWLRRL